jgi:hypothetical protein
VKILPGGDTKGCYIYLWKGRFEKSLEENADQSNYFFLYLGQNPSDNIYAFCVFIMRLRESRDNERCNEGASVLETFYDIRYSMKNYSLTDSPCGEIIMELMEVTFVRKLNLNYSMEAPTWIYKSTWTFDSQSISIIAKLLV